MEEDYRKKLKRREKERELRRKTVARKKKMLLAGAGEAVLIVILAVSLNVLKRQDKAAASEMKEGAKKEEVVSFTVSAAGDCTLGTDAYFDYATGFTGKYDAVQNPAYFFEKVKPFFETDDLTIVNMEGTLTESDTREEKQFAFKADREYADILTAGAVEAANLANNHSKDYGEVSYTDTIAALDAVGVTSFGYDRTAVMEVKGIKVGLVGTYELADHMDCEKGMKENIEALKEQGTQVIIASFHWGAEREYVPNDVQIALAHSAVDSGADLVIGHHPHVLQGIEEYKGKNIVYSLGNFCFGGNSGPSDMDTMIFQQTFTVKDGKLQKDNVTDIIPCKISSAYYDGYNNYQPMPAEGEEKERIMSKIEEYSRAIPTGNEG